MPDRARKVPEEHGLAIRDEEGLAVDTLRIDWNSRTELVCAKQSQNPKDVTVRYVLNICEIEEVVVFADLVLGLSILEGLDHLRKQLYVSFAEDTCRTNGAGEETLRLAVCFEYVCFGVGLILRLARKKRTSLRILLPYLGGSVVLRLRIASN